MARLKPGVVSDHSSKVEHIADLIRGWRFRYGETYKALAREWGVSYDYVRRCGAEAFRIVGDEVAEPEETTTSVCVGLERIMRDAIEGDGSKRDAIEAAKVWAQLAKDRKGKATGGHELTESVLESLLDAVRSRRAG